MSPRQHRLPIYFLFQTNKVVPACFWKQETRCRHALPNQSVSHDMGRKSHRANRYRRAGVVAQREVSVSRKDADKVRPKPARLECAIDIHFARIPVAQDQVIQDRLTKIGRPLQAGMGPSISPSASRLISIRTGAPAARALALGFQDPIKGAAATTTPAVPAAAVEPARKRLRPALVLSSVTSINSLRSY